jgi:hypothetical protein
MEQSSAEPTLPEVQSTIDAQRLVRDNLRRVPLASMKPAPYNPREIGGEELDALKFSLEKYGMVEAIVWNERGGNIVGGHRRYEILKAANQSDGWAFVVDLDEIEERMLNLTLNNPGAQGKFNSAMLGDMIKMLKTVRKPEDFKKSGLLALEKQLPLFDEKKAALPIKDEADKMVKDAEKAIGQESLQPKPDVRVVQLFYNPSQHASFMKGIQDLCAALSLDNVSDTVFKLVQLAAAKLAPPTADGGAK